MLRQDLLDEVDAIARDTTSGAFSIGERATSIFSRLADGTPPGAFLETLRVAGQAIVSAQPAMAPLRHLVNSVFWAVGHDVTTSAGVPAQTEHRLAGERVSRDRVRETAHRFGWQMRKNAEEATRHGTTLLGDTSHILTISFSSAVTDVLLKARGEGKQPRVICLESRPGFEGRSCASTLSAEGIPVTLAIDAAAAALLHNDRDKITHILIGADSVSDVGVVNKVGTLALAQSARGRVPIYAIATTEKLWPTPLLDERGHQHAPEEVLPGPIAGVVVDNRYFDCTPLSILTGMVTEHGLLTADAVRSALAGITVHPWLLVERHVVTCFLLRKSRGGDRILLLRRSEKVSTYRRRWAGVSGTIETTADEQAFRELAEETRLSASDVTLLARGDPLFVDAPELGRRWIVHPYLFQVTSRARPQTDWEHTRHRWVEPAAISELETVPGLAETLARVYPLSA